MPKLPKYVFQRANGSYRYKRNVPVSLRQVIPKATVYRQLGTTYDEAIRRLPKVHSEIEALFDLERRTTPSQRALNLDLSRFSAAPSARLSHFPFESDGAFPAQC